MKLSRVCFIPGKLRAQITNLGKGKLGKKVGHYYARTETVKRAVHVTIVSLFADTDDHLKL
jgi:hypothetical protein